MRGGHRGWGKQDIHNALLSEIFVRRQQYLGVENVCQLVRTDMIELFRKRGMLELRCQRHSYTSMNHMSCRARRVEGGLQRQCV